MEKWRFGVAGQGLTNHYLHSICRRIGNEPQPISPRELLAPLLRFTASHLLKAEMLFDHKTFSHDHPCSSPTCSFEEYDNGSTS